MRPREKLKQRGVVFLSDVELLQIIISSGGKGYSAARIAKQVHSRIEDKSDELFRHLLEIPGLGDAKVCQLIAAIELGGRLARTKPIHDKVNDFTKARLSARRSIQYVTYDGDGVFIDNRCMLANGSRQASVVIRQMFSDALHDKARSIQVGIGWVNQLVAIVEDDDLSDIKAIFEAVKMLEINLDSVCLVNRKESRSVNRKYLA